MSARTVCRFGSNRRGPTLWACETVRPTTGPLPQTSHRLAMMFLRFSQSLGDWVGEFIGLVELGPNSRTTHDLTTQQDKPRIVAGLRENQRGGRFGFCRGARGFVHLQQASHELEIHAARVAGARVRLTEP